MSRRRFPLCALVFALLSLAALGGCDVHEFPAAPGSSKLVLNLSFDTPLPVWEQKIVGETRSTKTASKAVQVEGEMRYTLRLYPLAEPSSRDYGLPIREYVFYRDIAPGYDASFTIEVPTGEYSLLVWADLCHDKGGRYFYDLSSFGGITFSEPYTGNNDYRDAFLGKCDLKVETDILERAPQEKTLEMHRPLAKFEFLSEDLREFIARETKAAAVRERAAEAEGGTKASGSSDGTSSDGTKASGDELPETKAISLEGYKAVCTYTSYLPNTFNAYTVKSVDSSLQVSFEGGIVALGEAEASLGFDYVFVSDKETFVDVQIDIYDPLGNRVSHTGVIRVPLKRNRFTIMRGSFLMQSASGGISIVPDFDNDFNIFIGG